MDLILTEHLTKHTLQDFCYAQCFQISLHKDDDRIV